MRTTQQIIKALTRERAWLLQKKHTADEHGRRNDLRSALVVILGSGHRDYSGWLRRNDMKLVRRNTQPFSVAAIKAMVKLLDLAVSDLQCSADALRPCGPLVINSRTETAEQKKARAAKQAATVRERKRADAAARQKRINYALV